MVDTTTKPHIAMVVSPGMGHLIPTLELAKRLISNHQFQVTIFHAKVENSPSSPLESDLLHQSQLLQVTPLPATVPLLDPSASPILLLRSMMRSTLPHLRSSISQLASPPTVLIVDLFSTEALALADAFGMKKYVFCTSNTWFLALALHVEALNEEEISLKEEVRIPGCNPICYRDLPESLLEWGTPAFNECARLGSEMTSSDAILVNTWQDLEPSSIISLNTNMTNLSIHPIGPITQQPSKSNSTSDEVLSWMDDQPSESVLYVSFGSGGMLSAEQATELAYGLELSQQRFVWVIRAPSGSSDFLPPGFMERTQDVGKIVWVWAPQADILAHPAVGGFLSHAGWNSVLESLVNGVPLIVWPLYAEQRMNATLLCEEVKVAIRPEAFPDDEVIRREEIERMVRSVMVEGLCKDKAKELQMSAKQALSEGGTSFNSLAQAAKECDALNR